jgi:hypothetical protein
MHTGTLKNQAARLLNQSMMKERPCYPANKVLDAKYCPAGLDEMKDEIVLRPSHNTRGKKMRFLFGWGGKSVRRHTAKDRAKEAKKRRDLTTGLDLSPVPLRGDEPLQLQ